MVTDALVTPAWPLEKSATFLEPGPPLVNQVHEVACADLCELAMAREPTHRCHVGDTQHKADGVEDIRLSRAVEAGDSVERLIEACGQLLNVSPEMTDQRWLFARGTT
jgi:hypothetical protein